MDHSIGYLVAKLHTIGKLSADFLAASLDTLGWRLNLDYSPLGFDFVELVQFSLPAAGAYTARMFPILFSLQIGVPEWPRAALARAGRIDTALTRLVVEENAVAVGKLPQTFAGPDAANVAILECFDVQSH